MEENINLNRIQQRGITEYGLTVEQVQTPNFGNHTLNAIDRLQYENNELTESQAFNQVAGLNRAQTEGTINYGLTLDDVYAPNFNENSLRTVDYLRRMNPTQFRNNRTAFNHIRGLNEEQVDGFLHYNLTREQVETPGYSERTLDIIDDVRRSNRRYVTPGETFEAIKNLNEVQIEGIRDYDLSREQVTSPNFGAHTLNGMNHLMQNNNATNAQAFNVVQGLTEIQINAMLNFNLRGRHILNDRLNEDMLLNIQVLQQQYPAAGIENVADIVMNDLLEYHARGLNMGLSPEQLGIHIENNELTYVDTYSNPGKTVDVVASLMQTEDMPVQEAYEVALSLSDDQITAMLKQGLRLAQVQDSAFDGEETISSVFDKIDSDHSLGEMEIPLTQVQQERAREIMDETIALAQLQEVFDEQSTETEAQTTTTTDAAQDLGALMVALNASEGESQQASQKKKPQTSQSTGQKKGGPKF